MSDLRCPTLCWQATRTCTFSTNRKRLNWSSTRRSLALGGFPCERENIRDRFSALVGRIGVLGARREVFDCCASTRRSRVHGSRDTPSDLARISSVAGISRAALPPCSAATSIALKSWTGTSRGPAFAPVLYPGSVERTSLAEKDEPKGYLILEFEAESTSGGRLERSEFRALPARPMFALTIDATGLGPEVLENEIREKLGQRPSDAVVHLRVEGDLPPDSGGDPSSQSPQASPGDHDCGAPFQTTPAVIGFRDRASIGGSMSRVFLSTCLIVGVCTFALSADAFENPGALPGVGERVEGLERLEAHDVSRRSSTWQGLPGTAAGRGSRHRAPISLRRGSGDRAWVNDVGFDRGRLVPRVWSVCGVRWEGAFEEVNLGYRAISDDLDQRRRGSSVVRPFGPVGWRNPAEDGDLPVLVDFSSSLRATRTDLPGGWNPGKVRSRSTFRSAVEMDACLVFPENVDSKRC